MNEGTAVLNVVSTDLDFSPVHERMQWYVDENILPFCATAVLRGTELIDLKFMDGTTASGSGALASGGSLGADTIYRMHSCSKMATSVVAMSLFEEGAFALDDPLETYLPEFGSPTVLRPNAKSIGETDPAQGPIRIKHILSHSAGLSYGFMEPDTVIDSAYIKAGVNPLARGAAESSEQLCERLGQLPLAYEPGTSWRYSLATDVVARLVEVLTNQRFDQVLSERLTGPLNMVDTDFWVPASKRNRLSTIYDPADIMQPMAPGLTPKALEPEQDAPPTFLSGGGGLFSTLADYIEFVRMLVNRGEWNDVRILRPETVELMRQNQLAPDIGVRFPMWHMPDTTFGLGFALKEAPARAEPPSAVGEYHWGGMGGTHFWMSPDANVTGICMTQRMPAFWHPFSREFKRMVYEIAG